MCVVSNVHDYFADKDFPIDKWVKTWPQIRAEPFPGVLPFPIDLPATEPSPAPQSPTAFELLKQAIEILKKVDALLGDKDCVDPAKEAKLKELEDKVQKARDALG